MSARDGDKPEVQTADSGSAESQAVQASPEFRRALKAFAEAVSTRKVELICSAYLALRRSARGMSVTQLLDAADAATAGQARAAALSAFSHRRCFMCEDGTSACGTCNATGLAGGFPCPQCDGLGMEPCPFCRGSAWSDRDQVPPEFRQAVLNRHLARVQKDAARLRGLLQTGAFASATRLPAERRRELIAWLIRLQGRLRDLAGASKGNGENRTARFAALAARIDEILQKMRPPTPSPPAKPKTAT